MSVFKWFADRMLGPEGDNPGPADGDADRSTELAPFNSGRRMHSAASEESVLSRGEEMVVETLDDHYQTLATIQHDEPLPNHSLLSGQLAMNEALPVIMRERVANLSDRLRGDIRAVAQIIEDENFRSLGEAVRGMAFSRFEKERVNELFNAQKQMHTSYQSVRVAVQLFQRVNRHLFSELETVRKSRRRTQEETDLLLKNSILVYELADSIIELIREFDLEGRDRLINVHQQIAEEVERNRIDDEALLERAQTAGLAERIKEKTEESVRSRQQMRELVNEEWASFLARVDTISDHAESVRGQLANLEMIRDNAKNQLGFLQIMAVTQMIRDNLEAFQGLLDIDDVPLAPISPSDLCRLLGIDEKRALPES